MSALGGDLREHIEQARSSLVEHRLDELCRRIVSALHSANEDGTVLSPEAWTRAIDVLRALLPYDAPLPTVVIESDGAVGLDWDESANRVLSLTVRDTPMVGYSALLGAEPMYGRMEFSAGKVPETLRFLLARFFPRHTAHAARRLGGR